MNEEIILGNKICVLSLAPFPTDTHNTGAHSRPAGLKFLTCVITVLLFRGQELGLDSKKVEAKKITSFKNIFNFISELSSEI